MPAPTRVRVAPALALLALLVLTGGLVRRLHVPAGQADPAPGPLPCSSEQADHDARQSMVTPLDSSRSGVSEERAGVDARSTGSQLLSDPAPNQLRRMQRPHWLLLGRVRGLDPRPAAGMVLVGYGSAHAWTDAHKLVVPIDPNGHFSVDLDPLTTTGRHARAHGNGPLLVEWRSETSAADEQRVSLSGGLDAGFDMDGRPLRILETELQMRSAGMLRGQLNANSRRPASGAHVYLVAGPAGGRPYALDVTTRSRADGSFELQSTQFGSRLLVAITPTDAPLVVPVELRAGAVRDLGMLELPVAVRIEGRVQVRGQAPRSTGIAAFLEGLPPTAVFASYPGTVLVWNQGRAHVYSRSASVAEDGTFVLEGLTPGPQRLIWSTGAMCTVPGLPDQDVVVNAPIGGLDLSRMDSCLRFEVRSRGMPCDDAHVTLLREPQQLACTTDADGISRWIVEPDGEYRFRIQRPGCEPQERTIKGPAIGESVDVRIELACTGTGEVHLVWEGPAAGEPTGPVALLLRGRNVPADGDVRLLGQLKRGGIVFPAVPEGLWQARIEPGGSWNGYLNTCLPTDLELSVMRDRRTELRVPARQGAVLRLLNLRQNPLRIVRIERLDEPGRRGESVPSNAWFLPEQVVVDLGAVVPAGATAVLIPAQLPGRYLVEAGREGGEETEVERVELIGGQVTTLPW